MKGLDFPYSISVMYLSISSFDLKYLNSVKLELILNHYSSFYVTSHSISGAIATIWLLLLQFL